MIVKVGNDFYASRDFPIMLIIDESEKAAIKSLSKDQAMIAFFPPDRGYDEGLIKQWMTDGVQVGPPLAPPNVTVKEGDLT